MAATKPPEVHPGIKKPTVDIVTSLSMDIGCRGYTPMPEELPRIRHGPSKIACASHPARNVRPSGHKNPCLCWGRIDLTWYRGSDRTTYSEHRIQPRCRTWDLGLPRCKWHGLYIPLRLEIRWEDFGYPNWRGH